VGTGAEYSQVVVGGDESFGEAEAASCEGKGTRTDVLAGGYGCRVVGVGDSLVCLLLVGSGDRGAQAVDPVYLDSVISSFIKGQRVSSN
jgi:hypothetical protein